VPFPKHRLPRQPPTREALNPSVLVAAADRRDQNRPVEINLKLVIEKEEQEALRTPK